MVKIAERIGQLQVAYVQNLHLRKNNRLCSIQASLAIENNSLSLEQVSDIINGRKVLGEPREIREVKNAFDAYENIPHLSPYRVEDFLQSHRLMMRGLVDNAGEFRAGDVGIFNTQGKVTHIGARPEFVPCLIADLFAWAKQDSTPALIKSCVMHYEIEVIHPFADGNGRMGRLWQTLMLSVDNPVFAWLPVETMVYQHQADYYATLAQADTENDSTVFIEFILSVILQTIEEYSLVKMSDKLNDIMSDTLSDKEQLAYQKISHYLQQHPHITNQQAQKILEKSPATVRRYLRRLVDCGLLIAIGKNKARVYVLVTQKQA